MLFGHDEGKNLKQLCDGLKDLICIAMGGTGADNPEDARKNLGIGAVATENVLPIEKGGTGANTLDGAKEKLGLSDTGWQQAVLSTNFQTGGTVLYRQIGNEVFVKVSGVTATALAATSFDNSKLVATGLPVPKFTPYGVGRTGSDYAMFAVTNDEFASGGGRLVIFGVSDTIASGSATRAGFSYLID